MRMMLPQLDYVYLWSEGVLPLIDILAWPLTVLLGVIFFRRIIAYLFLSIESYNFFGAKGSIRPVHEVIEERAIALKEAEERELEYKEIHAKLNSHDLEASEYRDFAYKMVAENQTLSTKLADSELQRKRLEFEAHNRVGAFADAQDLQKQIDALLKQIHELQSEELKKDQT